MHNMSKKNSSKNLFVWQSSVHFLPSFTCGTCEKAFGREERPKHMLIVLKDIHPSQPLKCKTCTWAGCWHRRFCCASCYITFKCNHCGKNFSRKSMLIRHMLVVFGAKVMARRWGKYLRTNNSINRHKKELNGRPDHSKIFRNFPSGWSATWWRPPLFSCCT